MQNNKKYKAKTIQKQDGLSFTVELTLNDARPFSDILMEAIDKSLMSLGVPAKTAVYFYLENSMEIKKHEIPFRISDFQNALEKLFGIGARHLEILIIKKLHKKIKIKYKDYMPSWVVPDLTFQEYIRHVKMTYENSNEESTNST